MHNGKYIVIDGAAAAKSAMVEMLVHQLEAIELPAHLIDERNISTDDSPSAIQRLIDDPAYPLYSRAEVLLHNAVRAQTSEIIRKIRNDGKLCISTQSFLSTLVHEYYGSGHIADYRAANSAVQFASADIQPDLLIVLDTVNNAGSTSQSQEAQALFERLRAGYLWEARQRGLPVIYATNDLDATFAQIWAYVAQLLAISPAVPVPTAMVRSAQKSMAAPANASPLALASLADGQHTLTVSSEVTPPIVTPQARVSIAALEASDNPIVAENWQQMLLETPFEQKDNEEHYRYYIPAELKGKLRSQYIRTMNQQFATYAELFNQLSEHLRNTASTPQAKQGTTWESHLITKTRQFLLPLIPLCATPDLPPSVGASSNKTPTETMIAIDPRLAALAAEHLPAGYATATDPVMLISYLPRNELDLAADVLYVSADLPFRTLQETMSQWSYERKAETLTLSETNGACYEFEVVSDYASYREVHSQHPGKAMRQPINPRYGYHTPSIFEETSLSDAFDSYFDRTLVLYSALQAEQPHLAPYAALMGHQIRWRLRCTIHELMQLKTAAELKQQLIEKVSEVHPLVYSSALNTQVQSATASGPAKVTSA
jgi:thymidylate kinase